VRAVEQIAGALVFLLGLADVFLTVLYARAGTGLFSRVVTGACWRAMLALSRPAGRARGKVLSFCGPLNLTLLVFTWSAILILGAGLVLHPELGRTVKSGSGPSETDFATALYVGGSSLSLVGSSGYTPQTSSMRLLFLFNAVVGTSVISLTLTYLMQVYTALRSRNALGLAIDVLTGETGDAVRLLAAVAPAGDFSSAASELGDLASQMIETKEAHHFYPVLFYFRFEEPRYSVSRFTLIVLDAVSLLRGVLDGDAAERLKRSGAVEQLQRTSLMLVRTLEANFLPGAPPAGSPDPGRRAVWRDRCSRARQDLAAAGLPVRPDRAAAEAAYMDLRAAWDADLVRLGPALGYAAPEVDPAAEDAGAAARRRRETSP
jgi:hypothetical protein